ncbi:MAG: lipid-transfer protein [Cellvibrionales bacterium]|nr:lipid-transfer protein [Cellvibrionales bacterium]HCH20687.1 lipid-transfer protein [Cellvibrionales bacterium]
MTINVSGEAAIAGVANTEFSKNSGVSELELASVAVRDAIADAGLKPSDVDGMTTFTLDNTDEIEIARAVGIGDLSFYSRVPHGGGAATGLVHQAVMAVATGMAEVVVCYRALNGRSGHRYSSGVAGPLLTSDAIHWGWYTPYGLMTPASWVAMYTQRYMHLAENVQDAMFEIAHVQREYAAKNPAAFFYERPFDRSDYDASRPIVSPFKMLDCCMETDGGSAVVVTTAERAKDLKHPAVIVKGVAQAAAADMESMTSFYRPEIARIPSMDIAAKMAYEQSGLCADDIDAAVIYDAFTPIVLWQLESWGFCDLLEAPKFVLDGAMRSDGRLPTNTHGGQLSEAYIHGVNGIVEATRLVRGQSVNQPAKKVNNVLVTSGVGVPTGGALLGRPD